MSNLDALFELSIKWADFLRAYLELKHIEQYGDGEPGSLAEKENRKYDEMMDLLDRVTGDQ